MKTYSLLLLVFMSLIGYSQQKDIEFKVDKGDHILTIFGINNSSKPFEITLSLKGIKMLKGYTKPITKLVPPKGKIKFITLSFEYAVYEYKLSYTSKPVATEMDKKIQAYKKEDHYLKDLSKLNEGIVIFDDVKCRRCRMVTNYLVANDIDFKIIDISLGKENTNLMWKTIKEKGASLNVKRPVILVDGELSHSHKDLQVFLETLK